MIKHVFIVVVVFIAGLLSQKYFSVWEKGVDVFQQGLLVITDKAAVGMKNVKANKDTQKVVAPITKGAVSVLPKEEKPQPSELKKIDLPEPKLSVDKPKEMPVGRDEFGDVFEDENGLYGYDGDNIVDVNEADVIEWY